MAKHSCIIDSFGRDKRAGISPKTTLCSYFPFIQGRTLIMVVYTSCDRTFKALQFCRSPVPAVNCLLKVLQTHHCAAPYLLRLVCLQSAKRSLLASKLVHFLNEISTCTVLFHPRVHALIARMASKPFPLHVTDGVKNVASPEAGLNFIIAISWPTPFG